MKNDPAQVAEKIKNYFDSHFFLLTLERQHQYCSRMYRVTGEDSYLQAIKNYLYYLDSKLKFYSFILESGREREEGLEILKNQEKTSWYVKMNRNQIYYQFPEFKFYQAMLRTAYWIFSYQAEELTGSREYIKIISHLRKINFKKYLLDKSVITLDPSQNTNYVFWLNEMGIVDIIEKFQELLLEVFPIKKVQVSSLDFHNQIYGYTHLIIAKSNFYQKFVDSESHVDIINFLSKNIKKITENGSIDMIAEVGVALRLLNQKGEIMEKISRQLLKEFNGQYIEYKNYKGLNRLQHPNMLAIIFFKSISKLYPGPTIKNIYR